MAEENKDIKLGKICSFRTGKLDSNAAVEDGQYPFFTCSQETYRTNTYSFDTDAVILGGNNANGIYPIKYFKGKFDAYQRTYIIRALDEKILANRFLYYSLRLKLDLLRSISTGVATKFLTLTILNDLNISVPSLANQNKIIAILSAYDDLIKNNNHRIKILEEMARTIYNEWFVNFCFPGHSKVKMVKSELGEIPEGWKVANLFEVSEITYGNPFESKLFSKQANSMPVIRIRDILNGITNTYTNEVAEQKYIVNNGDILVGMDGDFHMCRWGGRRAYLNQRVARFRPKNNISSYYLFWALKKHIDYFNATITGTTVAHLGDSHLKTIKIIIPEPSILKQSSEMLNPLYDLELTLFERNIYLQQARNILLPRLISGELDVEHLDIKVAN